jgi:hypothetical protein
VSKTLRRYLLSVMKAVSITRYINIQITSSSKTRSDVNIQAQSNSVLGINLHVVSIKRWLN